MMTRYKTYVNNNMATVLHLSSKGYVVICFPFVKTRTYEIQAGEILKTHKHNTCTVK